MLLIIRTLVLFTVLLISVVAQAQQDSIARVDAATIKPSVNLHGKVDITFTNPSALLSDVLQETSWQQQFSIAPMQNNQVMWIRFSLHNSSALSEELRLLVGNTFIDRVDGFLLDEQGRIIQSIQRNINGLAWQNVSSPTFQMELLSRPDQALYIYLRVHDDGPSILPIDIWQENAFNTQESVRFVLLSALSGGLSLLASFFFLTFLCNNDNARFWLSIFSVATMTTLLSAEGILPNLFGFPSLAAEITAFSLTATLFAAIKVSRVIFSEVSTLWLRAHYLLLVLPAISLFMYSDYWKLVTLLTALIIFLISKLIATIVYRRKLDMLSTALYFVAWVSFAALAFLEILNALAGNSHLSSSAAAPLVIACFGVMLMGVSVYNREISSKQQAERSQHAQINSLSQYHDLFQHAAEGLYSADATGKIIKANPSLFQLFGFETEQKFLVSKPNVSDLFAHKADADLLMGELGLQKTDLGKEIKGRRADGGEFWLSVSCQLSKVKQDLMHFGSLFDITERRLDQLNLQYLNTHDQLTGLYNRRHFMQLIDEKIEQHQPAQLIALLYIDVDQFKIINDTCGHVAGDMYIKEIAQELFDALDESCSLARLSGDEFGLLTVGNDLSTLQSLAERLLHKVQQFEFAWDKHRFTQSVSIGVCEFIAEQMDASELLYCADTACTVAKEQGRNQIHTYSTGLGVNEFYEREKYWLKQITRAVKDDDLQLFYQHYRPLNRTDSFDYVEVLVRLKTDDGKLIAPKAFMPAAERHHLSHVVDSWVVDNTFKWISQHQSALSNMARCHINLSAPSLSEEEFKYFLLNALQKYNIEPATICFDISETVAMIKNHDTIAFIKQFKRLGCHFALDHFGTGFSSYGYLKNLAVDYVKINGNFVRDMLKDPIDLAMVTSIKDVSQAMNIKTIAAFVESEEVMVQLGKLGVDYAQGFAVAEPYPISQFMSYHQIAQEK